MHLVNMFTKKKFDSFGKWTSRRPWKEGKCAAKSRGNNSMQFAFPGVEPELIYYERYSGVIGCTREELFQIAGGIDYSSWGYDKVIASFLFAAFIVEMLMKWFFINYTTILELCFSYVGHFCLYHSRL
ncbi:hypothetical protein Dimus_035300 [Dionaea muscipula]